MSAVHLAFVFIISSLTLALEQDEECKTPRSEDGTCISIRNCDVLMTMLKQRPVSQEVVDFLRDSQCGFQGKDPLVCCPGSSVTPFAGSSRQPVDVSNHRNLRLLPTDSCGLGSIERIINGNQTGLFEFPWMALIGYNTRNGLSFRCGGTLINKRYVLTAAHCLRNLPSDLELAKVRLGDHDVTKAEDCYEEEDVKVCMPDPQNFDVDESSVHPKYAREKLQNDIGLIRLSRNVKINDGVAPICLPVGLRLQTMNLERRKVIVSGWGATELGTMSPELLKVALRVMPYDQCARIYKGEVQITQRQICAGGEDDKDSCGGDSGGPLKYAGDFSGEDRYFQYGIVSFGPRRCATRGRPGVYTRVGYYMDWILNSLRP